MKAMILAAGLGQRMRPLTDTLPKPLLAVAGKSLLQYHLEALSCAGVTEVVINLAYLGDKISDFVGDGNRFGLRVSYSREAEPLETGGGLLQALPLLGDHPFLLINGDVWSQYPLANLAKRELRRGCLGHLVLVPNPAFHPLGDFALTDDGWVVDDQLVQPRYTFSGISLLHPSLVGEYAGRRHKFPLVEALRAAMATRQLTAEVFSGAWSDVGTPERLAALELELQAATQVSILKS